MLAAEAQWLTLSEPAVASPALCEVLRALISLWLLPLDPVRQVLLSCLFYLRGNEATEKLGDLPEVPRYIMEWRFEPRKSASRDEILTTIPLSFL